MRSKNARKAVNYSYKLTAIDRIILMRSDPLIHTEFQFSERYAKISHSATLAQDTGCCRFRLNPYKNHQWWEDMVLPMTDDQEDRAWAEACELSDLSVNWLTLSIRSVLKNGEIFFGKNAKKYDTFGLGSFGTSWNIIKPHPDKWWCSEDFMELVKAAYEWKNLVPHFYTPTGAFFEMYDRLGLHYCINQE